jgi:hypothetical protein
MVQNGCLENADAVSLHPYGLSTKTMGKRVSEAKKIIEDAGYNHDIWITEIGSPQEEGTQIKLALRIRRFKS